MPVNIYDIEEKTKCDNCRSLIHEVMSLKHELENPAYMYSGRITRAAIMSRNQQISELRTKIDNLKKEFHSQSELVKELQTLDLKEVKSLLEKYGVRRDS